jgi:hypothetical protein
MASAQQNSLVSEISISNDDWNLLFDPMHNEAVRGARAHEFQEAPVERDMKQDFQKIFEQQPSEGRSDPLPLTVPVIDPLFLTRVAMLAHHVVFSTTYQFVVDFIQTNGQTCGNFECDEESCVIRGGLFDETRFVEYQVKIFAFKGRLGICLEIQKGFAPSVQEFWNELQQELKEKDLLDVQDEESDCESDFLESSDEEDGLPDLDLDEAKFLNLHESPELVEQWKEDLENPNFMQQTLLQLAWNCQNADNFNAVAGDNQAQQLFDTIIACMIATAADFCLPIARCASLLVSQIVDAHDVQVSDEQFNVLVQTLVRWSLKNQEYKSKLTSSEEIASILSQQMSKMAPRAVNYKETLERVYLQAPYDCVRTNLHNVIQAY